MAALMESLEPLVAALRADGRTVVGPTVSGGSVVLGELESAADLPYGWGVDCRPGGYRLRRRADRAAFAHQLPAMSWKRYLHPPRVTLCSIRRNGFVVTEPDEAPTRYAFLGVRPCDLRAVAVQDRVLGAGSGYARRRAAAFLVAVNCTEPAPTCFCTSTAAADLTDLVLTELVDGDAVSYLAEAGSPAGDRLLATLPGRLASGAEVDRARALVRAAAGRTGRTLPAVDLRALLAERVQAGHWDDVAQRCLACGNCTMVCPTCFCTTVEDTSDLTGEVAGRRLRWDSCFDRDFSYLHGGPVRPSVQARYRQWLTHKLGTWHDQFGESGCVGCGRCIVWCPVGIDLTAELAALAAEEVTP